MPGCRLPAAAAVALLHAALLALLWDGARSAAPPVAPRGLELRLIARPQRPEAARPLTPLARPQPPDALRPAPRPGAVPDWRFVVAPLPASPTGAGGGAEAATEPQAVAAAALAMPAAAPLMEPARRGICAPAAHPALLRERGIEGVVRLRVWVDELGHAGKVLVAASSGFRLFDEAALAQARRCPYEAARRGGEGQGSWVEFAVRFALREGGGIQDE